MKHNTLSAIQMCDQGQKIVFDSEKCEIRKEGSEKLVAITKRTQRNIYLLNEIGKERCFTRKDHESWLWHKRMGHLNFDNLVKIRRRESLREMLEISKPTNTLCKQCLYGKKNRTKFKSKEYSTKKPLETMLLVDDYTRMTAGFFPMNNIEEFEHFKIYKEMVKIEIE
jgi:hypothetical protein